MKCLSKVAVLKVIIICIFQYVSKRKSLKEIRRLEASLAYNGEKTSKAYKNSSTACLALTKAYASTYQCNSVGIVVDAAVFTEAWLWDTCIRTFYLKPVQTGHNGIRAQSYHRQWPKPQRTEEKYHINIKIRHLGHLDDGTIGTSQLDFVLAASPSYHQCRLRCEWKTRCPICIA